jgi:hypothetical protein
MSGKVYSLDEYRQRSEGRPEVLPSLDEHCDIDWAEEDDDIHWALCELQNRARRRFGQMPLDIPAGRLRGLAVSDADWQGARQIMRQAVPQIDEEDVLVRRLRLALIDGI